MCYFRSACYNLWTMWFDYFRAMENVQTSFKKYTEQYAITFGQIRSLADLLAVF